MKESTKQQKPRKPVIEIVDNYSPTSSQPLEGIINGLCEDVRGRQQGGQGGGRAGGT